MRGLHNFYCSPNIVAVKEDKIGRACSTHEEDEEEEHNN
jgi:hypothetical protein